MIAMISIKTIPDYDFNRNFGFLSTDIKRSLELINRFQAPEFEFISLPFDGGDRLRRDIDQNAVNAFYFV